MADIGWWCMSCKVVGCGFYLEAKKLKAAFIELLWDEKKSQVWAWRQPN